MTDSSTRSRLIVRTWKKKTKNLPAELVGPQDKDKICCMGGKVDPHVSTVGSCYITSWRFRKRVFVVSGNENKRTKI